MFIGTSLGRIFLLGSEAVNKLAFSVNFGAPFAVFRSIFASNFSTEVGSLDVPGVFERARLSDILRLFCRSNIETFDALGPEKIVRFSNTFSSLPFFPTTWMDFRPPRFGILKLLVSSSSPPSSSGSLSNESCRLFDARALAFRRRVSDADVSFKVTYKINRNLKIVFCSI